MTQAYIRRNIISETEKAFLVAQEVNNRRDGWHTNHKWVAKSLCKDRQTLTVNGITFDTVDVSTEAVANGVW
jgi:hypothetical protein